MSSPAATATLPASPPAPVDLLPARERHWLGPIAVGLFLLALFTPPWFLGDDRYWVPLATKYLAIALFALSVDLVWGYAGLLSLGQGVYFGLGSYAIGYSLKLAKTAQQAGAPPGSVVLPDFMEYCRLPAVPGWIVPLANIWVAIVVAVVLPALVALAFGVVVFRLRIKGVYFSLITQALVLAVFLTVVNQQAYTGGVVGMTYLARLELFGVKFEMAKMYYLVAAVLTLCFLGCAWLIHGKFGQVITAIRDNEYRVLALGYNTALYKAFIFALAGGLAGVSGALYTAANGTAGPEHLGIAFSIEAVILVAVGGRGTLIGAVLGAILVRLANTYINDNFKHAWPIILGGLFVVVVVFMPEGIVGLLRKAPARLRRGKLPAPA